LGGHKHGCLEAITNKVKEESHAKYVQDSGGMEEIDESDDDEHDYQDSVGGRDGKTRLQSQLAGADMVTTYKDPSWESEMDNPDSSPEVNPAPTFDFDAAQAAWRANKAWDEKERELRIPRQVGDRVYIRDGVGTMGWLRAVVTLLPAELDEDGRIDQQVTKVSLEEGPREGEILEVT